VEPQEPRLGDVHAAPGPGRDLIDWDDQVDPDRDDAGDGDPAAVEPPEDDRLRALRHRFLGFAGPSGGDHPDDRRGGAG
jgi:hypothetical protein